MKHNISNLMTAVALMSGQNIYNNSKREPFQMRILPDGAASEELKAVRTPKRGKLPKKKRKKLNLGK